MGYRLREKKITRVLAELESLVEAKDIIVFPASLAYNLFEALKVAKKINHRRYKSLKEKWILTKRDEKLICVERKLRASWKHQPLTTSESSESLRHP
jgi:hypothetical protein